MAEFKIFSYGSCDIDRKIAKKYKINIIPFYVSLDSTNYLKEIDELSIDEFYKNIIENNIFPKTSLPSVQDYINAFTPSLEEGKDILCYTITDSLSGSNQSANTAKFMLEEKFKNSKIYIVNSFHATGSQMLLILEASRMQKEGFKIETIYNISEKMKIDARIIFMIGTLENLKRGGRIGKIAALSGSILNIKPIIILKDGEISTAGVSRSRKKGFLKITDLVKEHFNNSNEDYKKYKFSIGTTNTPDELEIFKTILTKELPNAEFLNPFQIGATIATHTGIGTIGVCFIKKYEYYI